MPFRILHFSDLHLDAAFAALGPVRRSDLRDVLGRILTLARERCVDAVTIGGDLYEQDYVLPDTGAFLVQQFARLAPIRVFIAPGECDPYTNDSLYALTRWPDNVTVFSQGQLAPADLAPGVRLWGAACPPARGAQLLTGIPAERSGIDLLLLHATDLYQRVPGSAAVFETSEPALRAAGLALALLGHAHVGRLWPENAPYCVYPGSPEPLESEDVNAQHTVALVTIQQSGCDVELVSVNQWRQHAVQVDLTGCESISQAAARVQQALGPTANERLISEVTPIGAPAFSADTAAVLAQVETPAQLFGQARFEFPYDLEYLAQEQTVRGLLVRRFQSRLAHVTDKPEQQRQLRALALALQALDGKQVQTYEIA